MKKTELRLNLFEGESRNSSSQNSNFQMKYPTKLKWFLASNNTASANEPGQGNQ